MQSLKKFLLGSALAAIAVVTVAATGPALAKDSDMECRARDNFDTDQGVDRGEASFKWRERPGRERSEVEIVVPAGDTFTSLITGTIFPFLNATARAQDLGEIDVPILVNCTFASVASIGEECDADVRGVDVHADPTGHTINFEIFGLGVGESNVTLLTAICEED